MTDHNNYPNTEPLTKQQKNISKNLAQINQTKCNKYYFTMKGKTSFRLHHVGMV